MRLLSDKEMKNVIGGIQAAYTPPTPLQVLQYLFLSLNPKTSATVQAESNKIFNSLVADGVAPLQAGGRTVEIIDSEYFPPTK